MESNIASSVFKRINRSFEFPFYLIWIFLAYGIGLESHSVLFTGDQKLYISTAMEMREHQEWLFPFLMGEHSYYKPPWVYWTLLLSWKLFGFNSFATYLPSVLALVGTAGFLGEIEGIFRKFKNSGLFFAGMAGAMTYGLSVQMEIWVVFFYAGAWWAGLKFLKTQEKKYLYLAFVITGLSALVKSPLYSVFWVLSFIFYLVLQKKWKELKSPHLYLGCILGILLGFLWYAYVFIYDADHFWAEYVARETLSKVGGNRSSILRMWLDFSTFLFPYILAVVPGLVFLKNEHKLLKFALAWSLVPALFFNVFPYRTETYLFILVPVFAFLIFEKKWTFLFRFNGILLFALFLFLGWVMNVSGMISGVLLCFLIFCSACFAIASWKAELKYLGLSGLLIVLALRWVGISIGEQDVKDVRDLLKQYPTSSFAVYDEGKNIWNEVGVFSVTLGRPMRRLSHREELERFLKSGGLVILDEYQSKDLNFHFPVKRHPWLRWKRGFSVPSLQDLLSIQDRGSVEWKSKNKREFQVISL